MDSEGHRRTKCRIKRFVSYVGRLDLVGNRFTRARRISGIPLASVGACTVRNRTFPPAADGMSTATATHPSLLIPVVEIRFVFMTGEKSDWGAWAELARLTTDNAVDAFRFLETAAAKGADVYRLTIDAREIDAASLAGLNAYLRTPRALNWNGVLPFSRIVRHRSRWSWAMFLAYLDVTFAPPAA